PGAHRVLPSFPTRRSSDLERFDGALREAHRLVREGAVGEPVMVRALHQHGSIDAFGPDDWYRQPGEGGPELSLMWYAADALCWRSEEHTSELQSLAYLVCR